MTVTTTADLPLRSPLSPAPRSPGRMDAGALTLADLTGIGLLHLRGAEATVRSAYADLPLGIGGVLAGSDRLAVRLTDDEWLLISAEPADAPDLSALSPLATATDLSHGYGVLLVDGSSAAGVLSKLCALDFSGAAFPDLRAAQTSLASTRALVLRRDHADRPAYLIAVGRSVAEYVWDRLTDAAAEFEPELIDGAPLIRPLIEGVPK